MYKNKEYKKFKETYEELGAYIEERLNSVFELRVIFQKEYSELPEVFENSKSVCMAIDEEALPAVYTIEVMMLNLLMLRFSIIKRPIWGLRILAARYKLLKITGWNMKYSSYDNKDIIKHIMDWYDEIYEDVVKDYMRKAGKNINQIYGRMYCPIRCPWNLQDLIGIEESFYQALLEKIHYPINNRDATHLIKKCEFIESLHGKVFS